MEFSFLSKKNLVAILRLSIFMGIVFRLYGSDVPKKTLASYSEQVALHYLDSPRLVNSMTYLGFDDEVTAISFTFQSPDGELYNMLMSSSESRTPLMRHCAGEDPELLLMEKLKMKAATRLAKPEHNAVYFWGFGEVWHRFKDREQVIYVNARPTTPVLDEAGFQARKSLSRPAKLQKNQLQDREIKAQWERFREGKLLKNATTTYVPHYEDMPNYAGHLGCTPTAAADVFGYYNYAYGYGNLIKYYYEEENDLSGNTDQSVPDAIAVLADKLNTDAEGGTDHLQPRGRMICDAAAEQDPDYDWDTYGTRLAGIWKKLTEEIDDGYPCVISMGIVSDGHSVAVLGYQENPDYFYVYDTWDVEIQKWSRTLYNLRNLAWFHPSPKDKNDGFVLTSLKGDPSIGGSGLSSIQTNQYNRISWHSDDSGGKVSIYINNNSGNGTWDKLVDLNENPGYWDWLTPDSYAGQGNRIRIRLWNSDRTEVIGQDGSARDFTISESGLYQLENGVGRTDYWPESFAFLVTGNYWGVVGFKSLQEKFYSNHIELYSSIEFNMVQAEDYIGKDYERSCGFLVVNLTDGPPGPLGVQIANGGQGITEYVESEELEWGQADITDYWTESDVVKVYHFYVDEDIDTQWDNNYIKLENQGSSNFAMTLFDTHKRFNSYSDNIVTVDEYGQGSDENILLDDIEDLGGRYVVVVWQNTPNLRSGMFSISLVSESAFQVHPFPRVEDPDTLNYSGQPFFFNDFESEWTVIGPVPISGTSWKIEAASDKEFTTDWIESDLGFPFLNMILIKKIGETAENDSVFLRFTRKGHSGSALIKRATTKGVASLKDGLNSDLIWPAHQYFQLFPIKSQYSLIDLQIQALNNHGIRMKCGIAPNTQKRFVSTAQLWGGSFEAPENVTTVKEGVCVVYTCQPPEEMFTFDIQMILNETAIEIEDQKIPPSFRLHSNYPNPFNPVTTISYDLSESCFVTLKIFDIRGREIQTIINAWKQEGHYDVKWNTGELPAGIYLYRLQAGDYTETKKMILQK